MAVIINNMFISPIESSAAYGGAIEVFHNAFPEPLKAIRLIEQATVSGQGVTWQAASVGIKNFGRVAKDIRSNKNLGLSDEAFAKDSPELQHVHNTFYQLLLGATTFYTQKYNISEPLFHESYQALKYQTGEEYKAHYDGNSISGRFLSAITYLNDDYNGGELEFPNFGVKIKPREGDLFLFPSNYAYAHIAHPVTSGTKYAIVTWIHDRPVEQ
jgi:predicted 2-oxoglutarate/Fe(II)-dependent dioxygenase YbiX